MDKDLPNHVVNHLLDIIAKKHGDNIDDAEVAFHYMDLKKKFMKGEIINLELSPSENFYGKSVIEAAIASYLVAKNIYMKHPTPENNKKLFYEKALMEHVKNLVASEIEKKANPYVMGMDHAAGEDETKFTIMDEMVMLDPKSFKQEYTSMPADQTPKPTAPKALPMKDVFDAFKQVLMPPGPGISMSSKIMEDAINAFEEKSYGEAALKPSVKNAKELLEKVFKDVPAKYEPKDPPGISGNFGTPGAVGLSGFSGFSGHKPNPSGVSGFSGYQGFKICGNVIGFTEDKQNLESPILLFNGKAHYITKFETGVGVVTLTAEAPKIISPLGKPKPMAVVSLANPDQFLKGALNGILSGGIKVAKTWTDAPNAIPALSPIYAGKEGATASPSGPAQVTPLGYSLGEHVGGKIYFAPILQVREAYLEHLEKCGFKIVSVLHFATFGGMKTTTTTMQLNDNSFKATSIKICHAILPTYEIEIAFVGSNGAVSRINCSLDLVGEDVAIMMRPSASGTGFTEVLISKIYPNKPMQPAWYGAIGGPEDDLTKKIGPETVSLASENTITPGSVADMTIAAMQGHILNLQNENNELKILLAQVTAPPIQTIEGEEPRVSRFRHIAENFE